MKTIKNRLLLTISAIFSLTIISGCKGELTGVVVLKNYIQVYVKTDTTMCKYDPETKLVSAWFYGERIGGDDWRFGEIAKSFEDTYYNRNGLPGSTSAVMDRFLSIDMVSDQDFDQAHPAGTSLADIVEFTSSTFYPFISSGYKNKNKHDRINKLLKDWTSTDMLLLCESGNFRFMTPPPAGEHNLKITFRSADKTLVTNLKVNFE